MKGRVYPRPFPSYTPPATKPSLQPNLIEGGQHRELRPAWPATTAGGRSSAGQPRKHFGAARSSETVCGAARKPKVATARAATPRRDHSRRGPVSHRRISRVENISRDKEARRVRSTRTRRSVPRPTAATGTRGFRGDGESWPERGLSAGTSRGAAAAASWIFRGERSRRRRGYHVDSPWETRAVKRAVVACAGG